MKVKLLAHTPNPEQAVTSAAKLCYSAASIEEIYDKSASESPERFIKMLLNMGHESPFEHISFTFGIEGVSRALLAQLTRHRIASYSVQSQRYVNNFGFEYVVPPEINDTAEAKSAFLSAMETAQNHYNKLTEILKHKHETRFINSGMESAAAEAAAEKCAIEDARYVLPNACSTKIICTFNARSLRGFFSARCCSRAQWEIRQLATEMLKLVLQEAPNVFADAGPQCVNKACPEGKMSCGNALKIRSFFKSLKIK